MIFNSGNYNLTFCFSFALIALLGLVTVGLFALSMRALIRRWRAVSLIKKLHYIACLVLCVGVMNFVCGMGIVELYILGGSATNGKIEQGQFYLGQYGIYTPVSSFTFWTCKYYEIFVLVTCMSLPAAFITYRMQEEPRETVLDANAFRKPRLSKTFGLSSSQH